MEIQDSSQEMDPMIYIPKMLQQIAMSAAEGSDEGSPDAGLEPAQASASASLDAEPADQSAIGSAGPESLETGAGPAGVSGENGGEQSIRVDINKVDQIINLVGELIITQSMLDQTVTELKQGSTPALDRGVSLLQRNARELQEAVMSIRMVPMEQVFSRFPDMVQALAARFGKDVTLHTDGKTTEVDKGLVDHIIDPLTHLVRNSIDHGIESAAEREAGGKPRQGRLLLTARQQGGSIIIEVEDDGAGLSREKLLARARSKGMQVSDSMSDEEVWLLIFSTGFSSAEEDSDEFGRAVGMDIVKRNVQNLGGYLEVSSRPGRGTTTRILLPLTLAILEGMLVRAGGETFVLPLLAVRELLQPAAGDIYSLSGDDAMLKVREEYLPVISVHESMGISGARRGVQDSIAVIVESGSKRFVLLVDELVGQQQVVVKNLESNYRKVRGVSAATILGDGRVAMILDVAELHPSHSACLKPAVGHHQQSIAMREVALA
ncbi:MAG: chemotaxis protein CheW [Pseudomonadales bacterium]|nr:chemotaxis protein CheW [Pseudomonadales bacterium]